MRRIVVTGGNKGIGKAICTQILTSYPNTFVYLGSRDKDRGTAAVVDVLNEIGEQFKNQIELLLIDVGDSQSVASAAAAVKQACGPNSLYGVVNNAGIGGGTALELCNVNLYGVKRVCDSFIPLLQDGGRVINVSSGSAPMFVNSLPTDQQAFWDTGTDATWEQLDARIQEKVYRDETDPNPTPGSGMPSYYGFSKACLNVYTMQMAQIHPGLQINSVSPGWIQTDMVAKYFGGFPDGTKPVAEGTKSSLHCLFGEAVDVKSGCYYGSDAVRSPLNYMRSPGSPAFNP